MTHAPEAFDSKDLLLKGSPDDRSSAGVLERPLDTGFGHALEKMVRPFAVQPAKGRSDPALLRGGAGVALPSEKQLSLPDATRELERDVERRHAVNADPRSEVVLRRITARTFLSACVASHRLRPVPVAFACAAKTKAWRWLLRKMGNGREPSSLRQAKPVAHLE